MFRVFVMQHICRMPEGMHEKSFLSGVTCWNTRKKTPRLRRGHSLSPAIRCEIRYNFVPEKHPSGSPAPSFPGAFKSVRPFRPVCEFPAPSYGSAAERALPTKALPPAAQLPRPSADGKRRDGRPAEKASGPSFPAKRPGSAVMKSPSVRTRKVALPSGTSHPSLFPTGRTSPKKESSGTKVRLTAAPAPTDGARARRDSLPFPDVSPQGYRKSARPRRPAPPACLRCG